MDTEQLVLIANNQAILAVLLVFDTHVTHIIHDNQIDFWLQQEVEVLPSLMILD
jgi:hypothetical protein